jgi:hypothetical protein
MRPSNRAFQYSGPNLDSSDMSWYTSSRPPSVLRYWTVSSEYCSPERLPRCTSLKGTNLAWKESAAPAASRSTASFRMLCCCLESAAAVARTSRRARLQTLPLLGRAVEAPAGPAAPRCATTLRCCIAPNVPIEYLGRPVAAAWWRQPADQGRGCREGDWPGRSMS